MNLILSDHTVIPLTVKTIKAVTRVADPNHDNENIWKALFPFEFTPPDALLLEVECIVRKESMKSIRKMGIGSTLCHENESYIVEAVDEMFHKKSDKFRMIILHAICYFPVA
jgi:hypothetical protein